MQEIRLPRKDKDDLVFHGELIASADDSHLPPEGNCWWELTLYQTERGRYVLAKAVRCADTGRRSRHEAVSFASPGDVHFFLAEENRRKQAVGSLLLERAREKDSRFMPMPS